MKLRPFELGLVIIFLGLLFVSLFFLSTYRNSGNSGDGPVIGSVTIWGVLPALSINEILDELKDIDETYRGVSYRYIDPTAFDTTLVNALADGTGPDLILVSHEKLIDYRKRIAPISYESYPLRDITNIYVDGARIFALNDGLHAYPIAVDPLVMYWNKDLLSAEGLLSAPSTWEDLVNSYFPNLIERNFDRSIVRSVVAMGEYQNVRNSFAMLSTLMLQSGMRGVVEDGNLYDIRLNESTNGSGAPLYSALDFYTRFSRVNNTLYSWNRSFTEDRIRFAGEDLSFYFGFGSEGRELERLNPNLNFDIAEMPQGAGVTAKRTYGQVYGFSLLRASRNQSGAAAVMSVLASRTYGSRIAQANNMAPAYRDLVSAGSSDTYGRVYYRAAGYAFGWLNPERGAVDEIFTTMTRDVNENRYDEAQAASDAIDKLEYEYR